MILLQAPGREKCLRPATLLKKRLWHRCFPVNFVKFLRTPFFIEHLCWLLLQLEIFAKVIRLISLPLLNSSNGKISIFMTQAVRSRPECTSVSTWSIWKNSSDPENAMFVSFFWKWNIGKIVFNYKTIP